MNIKFQKLDNNAKIPEYGSKFAAGMDLFSSNEESIIIEPQTRQCIPTGLAMSYDNPDYYMRIAPRSGLSVKHNIDVGAVVIDYDYRGKIGIVIINNHKTKSFEITKNMKIAQMIPTLSLNNQKIIFTEVTELDDTSRGVGGFGSTGI